MSIFSAKSFWLSLPFSGVLTYWLFWIQIPDALSGNPGADGTAVSGWPIPVETSGGCNFGGSCMDFSYPFFVIDIVILSFISALIAYYISSMISKNIKKETEVQGILTYLGSWLSVLALTAIPLVFIANIVDWRTKQIILKWSH